jgi:hypothetical protein
VYLALLRLIRFRFPGARRFCAFGIIRFGNVVRLDLALLRLIRFRFPGARRFCAFGIIRFGNIGACGIGATEVDKVSSPH